MIKSCVRKFCEYGTQKKQHDSLVIHPDLGLLNWSSVLLDSDFNQVWRGNLCRLKIYRIAEHVTKFSMRNINSIFNSHIQSRFCEMKFFLVFALGIFGDLIGQNRLANDRLLLQMNQNRPKTPGYFDQLEKFMNETDSEMKNTVLQFLGTD